MTDDFVAFFSTIRNKSLLATLDMMVAKFTLMKRLDDPVPERARCSLHRRIWLMMKKRDVVHRCPTHQSQVRQTSDTERRDFVNCINNKMCKNFCETLNL
jgi:hypothetical protein